VRAEQPKGSRGPGWLTQEQQQMCAGDISPRVAPASGHPIDDDWTFGSHQHVIGMEIAMAQPIAFRKHFQCQ